MSETVVGVTETGAVISWLASLNAPRDPLVTKARAELRGCVNEIRECLGDQVYPLRLRFHLWALLDDLNEALNKLWMTRRMSETVVGVAEIAAHAGVKPDTVQQWRIRHKDFPAPVYMLSMGPVWFLPVVEAWLEQTGRQQTKETRE